MHFRAALAWLVILALAIANGALRERVLLPGLGEQMGRLLSPLLLALLVFVVAWTLLPWIRPLSARDAWSVGILWLALTLAFEFLAGHYLFGDSWEHLLAEYNVLRGRLWVLVPVSTLVAPVVVRRAPLQQPVAPATGGPH